MTIHSHLMGNMMIFHGFQWENDPPMESKRFLGIQWECIGLIEPTTLNNTISGSPKTIRFSSVRAMRMVNPSSTEFDFRDGDMNIYSNGE
jgi:hypothetical protein